MSLFNRIFWILTIISVGITLSVGNISNVACLFQPDPKPLSIKELHGSGKIIFVPTNDFPMSTLEQFSKFFQETYQLNIPISPPLRLPPSAFDLNREQYIAELILAEAEKHISDPSSGTPVIPIVFTDQDMYIQDFKWRYAFSFREKGMAVVSTARMNYSWIPFTEEDQQTQTARLRKMVTKNIGVLYYHLPYSDHCRNAMFGNVLGPQELDLMSDHL